MANEEEIFELKFEGNGVNPQTVKPHDIAELIVNFEKSLLSTIKQYNPNIDTTSLLFAFNEVKNESLGLKFNSIDSPGLDIKGIVLSGFLLLSSSVNTGDFSGLNREAITGLRGITRFSKKYECNGAFKHNDVVVSTFNPNTEIVLDKQRAVWEEGSIYGKLIDVGGENPNVHIKINDEHKLIFDISEANAKKLAPKLFEKVKLTGEIKWDVISLEIIDFKLSSISDYSPGNTSKAINAIKGVTSGYWNSFKNDDEINNQLLRD